MKLTTHFLFIVLRFTMIKHNCNLMFSIIALLLCQLTFAADDFHRAREKMITLIEKDVTMTRFMTQRHRLNERVIQALAQVPRHQFVPANSAKYAYENRPLRIGYGQTISQPYIVAIMTEIIDLEADDVVLEIGTGSGYQAAILAELAKKVYTIEIIRPLGQQAAKRLQSLGYQNIESKISDGYYGWQEAAPFDAIVVTAAASHIPSPLIQQLRPGGKMIIPVGSQFLTQQLMVVEKSLDGKVKNRQILPVSFVPLTGDH